MDKGQMTVVAFIPARSGSTRVSHKNIRPLAGHPAIAYSITAALASGVFAEVICSTDSERYAEIARHYGAATPFLRPAEMAGPLSPDIEWVTHALDWLRDHGRAYDCFSILRPTSPFRLPATIQRAWAQFAADASVDSLRAVEKCRQHPCKMWVVRSGRMLPLIPFGPVEQPWHSSAYQALPEIYVQNASLEIARTRVVYETHTISGHTMMPFFTQGHEGLDVNDPDDWRLAEELVASGRAELPPVEQSPFPL